MGKNRNFLLAGASRVGQGCYKINETLCLLGHYSQHDACDQRDVQGAEQPWKTRTEVLHVRTLQTLRFCSVVLKYKATGLTGWLTTFWFHKQSFYLLLTYFFFTRSVPLLFDLPTLYDFMSICSEVLPNMSSNTPPRSAPPFWPPLEFFRFSLH